MMDSNLLVRTYFFADFSTPPLGPVSHVRGDFIPAEIRVDIRYVSQRPKSSMRWISTADRICRVHLANEFIMKAWWSVYLYSLLFAFSNQMTRIAFMLYTYYCLKVYRYAK